MFNLLYISLSSVENQSLANWLSLPDVLSVITKSNINILSRNKCNRCPICVKQPILKLSLEPVVSYSKVFASHIEYFTILNKKCLIKGQNKDICSSILLLECLKLSLINQTTKGQIMIIYFFC